MVGPIQTSCFCTFCAWGWTKRLNTTLQPRWIKNAFSSSPHTQCKLTTMIIKMIQNCNGSLGVLDMTEKDAVFRENCHVLLFGRDVRRYSLLLTSNRKTAVIAYTLTNTTCLSSFHHTAYHPITPHAFTSIPLPFLTYWSSTYQPHKANYIHLRPPHSLLTYYNRWTLLAILLNCPQ